MRCEILRPIEVFLAFLLVGTTVSSFSYAVAPTTSTANLNLADVVGGGDGWNTGNRYGINPVTGAQVTTDGGVFTETATGFDDRYHAVSALPLVDGVFVLSDTSTTGGLTKVSSTGDSISLSGNGQSEYTIFNGGNGAWAYNVYLKVGSATPVNYDPPGVNPAHSTLGMYSNKGITFDLDAIRAANPNREIDDFSSILGTFTTTGAAYRVYIDGDFKASGNLNTATQGVSRSIPISRSQRFLTLISWYRNSGGGGDAIVYADPYLSVNENLALDKVVTPVALAFDVEEGFSISNVTDGELDDQEPGAGDGSSFWLAPGGRTEAGFVVDLDTVNEIGRIDLQNTRFSEAGFHGTQDFRISVSLDQNQWTTVLEDTLADGWDAAHYIPIESFEFDPVSARYVKFEALSYYGAQAGLNEIRIFAPIPEPTTLVLLLTAGALLAVWLRRRR